MEEDKIVTIKVTWKIREKLKDRGKKGETYNDIITRMLEELVRILEESKV